MKEYVVMVLADPELEKALNDMTEEGYDVKEMFRNEPVAEVGRTTVVFKLKPIRTEVVTTMWPGGYVEDGRYYFKEPSETTVICS